MRKLILIFLASPAAAVLINGNQINPQTAISIATLTVTGARDASFAHSVTASSVTATGSGFKGAGTGLTGTAASLTAGNVTTNANLTGDVTSSGNATTLANIPAIAGTNLTGTAASLTAGHVTTNANLTGDVTSSGNAATLANAQPNLLTLSATGGVTVTSTITVQGTGMKVGSGASAYTLAAGTVTTTGSGQFAGSVTITPAAGVSTLSGTVGGSVQITNTSTGTFTLGNAFSNGLGVINDHTNGFSCAFVYGVNNVTILGATTYCSAVPGLPSVMSLTYTSSNGVLQIDNKTGSTITVTVTQINNPD